MKFVLVAAVGFLTFGWAVIPFSICYGQLWSTTARYLLDALSYGFVVAGSFAWLVACSRSINFEKGIHALPEGIVQ